MEITYQRDTSLMTDHHINLHQVDTHKWRVTSYEHWEHITYCRLRTSYTKWLTCFERSSTSKSSRTIRVYSCSLSNNLVYCWTNPAHCVRHRCIFFTLYSHLLVDFLLLVSSVPLDRKKAGVGAVLNTMYLTFVRRWNTGKIQIRGKSQAYGDTVSQQESV